MRITGLTAELQVPVIDFGLGDIDPRFHACDALFGFAQTFGWEVKRGRGSKKLAEKELES